MALTADDKRKNWVLYHLCLYLTLNATVFMAWCFSYTYSPFPWFVYPIFICGLALAIHYCLIYHPKSYWFPHIAAFVIINSLCIVTWKITPVAYPWFLWVIAVWGAVLIVGISVSCFLKHRRKNHQEHRLTIKKPVTKPTDDFEKSVVRIDIPNPSYSIVPVTPQTLSSFPTASITTPLQPKGKDYSVPVYYHQKQYEPLPTEPTIQKYQTTYFWKSSLRNSLPILFLICNDRLLAIHQKDGLFIVRHFSQIVALHLSHLVWLCIGSQQIVKN